MQTNCKGDRFIHPPIIPWFTSASLEIAGKFTCPITPRERLTFITQRALPLYLQQRAGSRALQCTQEKSQPSHSDHTSPSGARLRMKSSGGRDPDKFHLSSGAIARVHLSSARALLSLSSEFRNWSRIVWLTFLDTKILLLWNCTDQCTPARAGDSIGRKKNSPIHRSD
jgi:hypothetical protein